jgi:ABC-2 type transport system permease protein
MSADPTAVSPAGIDSVPPLRPVPGPSPTAGGSRRFFTLLWVMAVTEFKLTFHGTTLGYAWSLVRPLLMFGVLLAVFTQVFRFGDSVKDYPALLLLNVMLFTLFAEATQRSVTSVVVREQVVRKAQFPRLVIPLSIVLTELLDLALNLVAVFIFIVAYGVDPRWTWLLVPVVVLALLLVTTAVSMIVSALYPRFRDVLLIWTVLSTVLFYGTPVLYPIGVAPERFRHIVQLNPLTPIFEQAQKWVIDPNAPGALGATKGSEWLLAVSFLIFACICAAAWWIFKREAPKIAEEL